MSDLDTTHDSHAPESLRADDSQPRNNLILQYSILAVISLFGLRFVFDSYLDMSLSRARTSNLDESVELAARYRTEMDAYDRLGEPVKACESLRELLATRVSLADRDALTARVANCETPTALPLGPGQKSIEEAIAIVAAQRGTLATIRPIPSSDNDPKLGWQKLREEN